MSFFHAMSRSMPQPQGPQVSMNATNVSKVRFGSDCYAGARFAIDGDEDDKGPTNGYNDGARGQWLDQGLASEVWVERIVNSGSLDDDDSGTGRLQLTSARSFSIVRSGTGTDTCNITFNMYDAASGGNLLDSVTIDLIAEVTS